METPEHIKEFKDSDSGYWESFPGELEDIFTGSDKTLANYIKSAKESLEGAMGGRNIYTVALEEAMHRLSKLPELYESRTPNGSGGYSYVYKNNW